MSCKYVLDGSASVSVTLFDKEGAPKTDMPTEHVVVPGSLVEAMGPAQLDYQVEDGVDSILILTPDYQQGRLLTLVGVLFVVLCGALITGGFGI